MLKNIQRLTHSQEFKEQITNASILLDTNVFISLAVKNPAYFELFEILEANNCLYLTLDLCIFEFFKGSEKAADIIKKEKLIKEFAIQVIPSVEVKEEFLQIIAIYRKSSATISITDLLLATILKKYNANENFYLLTGNYTDFPSNFFYRKFILVAEEEKSIKPIVFLQLQKDAFIKGSKSFYE